METVNTAVIGLGQRGTVNMKNCLLNEGVRVCAVCDLYPDRANKAADTVEKITGLRPYTTTDYKDILEQDNIDAVIVCTSWSSHIKIAIDAMQKGKAVAMEVGGAYSLDECFELVSTWEQTKVPFMFLENCCYGKEELLATSMARAGLFGEIVHCHGSYGHDLRQEITGGAENRHYRLNEYLNRNCENYPTHELGPIAKVLGINRGNRMVSLVSVASKSKGLEQYINDRKDTIVNRDLIGKSFAQADVVNTIITCEDGSTISLRLDTTLPREYNREFTLHGTHGMYEQNTHCVFLDGDRENFNTLEFYKAHIGNAEKYEEEYLPSIWKSMTPEQKAAGHGGMDYFTFKDFFDRLRAGLPMAIDVYDAASWMCISCLSEQSIKQGGAPVEIPDFTKGEYKSRPRFDVF